MLRTIEDATLADIRDMVAQYGVLPENLMPAFSEEGGILSALNGFMERYKEICDGIPEIWNNFLAEAFCQGGGTENSGTPQPGTEGGKGKGTGSGRKSESGSGSDTIVGAIVEGGKQIDKALNGEEDSWSASFIDAAGSIHNKADYIG